LPSYVSTPEERIECSDEKKFQIVERVKERLESAGYKIVSIDGVRIELEDAWALVRASNTEPAIVLRFEGKTLEQLKKVEGIVKEVVDKVMKNN
jgi:phosphomannomutase/phosphoglucomutase